jgi:ribosomal protein RSM22 (predicted rRNA methylase)
MQLPVELRSGIDAELEQASSRDLSAAVRELSGRYRADYGRTGVTFLHSDLDAIAYATYRLPATFAAAAATFEEVALRRPELHPSSLLDFGAGPGTAAWAAAAVWPGLERIIAIEKDARMVRLGQSLAARSASRVLRDMHWRQVDVAAIEDRPVADVVVAAYVLGELGKEQQDDFARKLWEASNEVCILVEPGTPRGYAAVRHAGDVLAHSGAHIIAPFPHDWQCLESEDDWCHFSVRVPRTRMHRTAKQATLGHEDEKYAFVVASRTAGLPIAARVIRHPQVRSGHIRLVVCTPEGPKHLVVTRGNREGYRRAQDLAWGSAIAPEDAGLFEL